MNGNIDRDYRTMLQALADSRTVVLSLLSQLGLTDFRESHLQDLGPKMCTGSCPPQTYHRHSHETKAETEEQDFDESALLFLQRDFAGRVWGNFPFSGTEVYLFELMRMMKEQGHEVALFSMAGPRGVPSEFDQFQASNIDFKSSGCGLLRKMQLGMHAIYSRQARLQLGGMIEAFRPDVAHVRNIYHHLSPSILWELKRHHVPVVYHLNDFKLLCPSYNLVARGNVCNRCAGGNFWRVLSEGCYSGGRPASLVLAAEAYVHRWLRTYERCVNRFLAPSQFVRSKLIENAWAADKIDVLPHFQKIPQTLRAPTADAPILYFGRLSSEKGVADLLCAMQTLPQIRLKIAGDGPLRAELEGLARVLSLRNVEFLGQVQGADLDRLIAESRFSVLPSRAYETLGKTILESYAQARAVVASDLGSRREFVRNEETGLLYPVGNVEELARAIAFLYQHPESAAAMGRAGQDLLRQHHSPENHYAVITRLYEELAAGTAAPRRKSRRQAVPLQLPPKPRLRSHSSAGAESSGNTAGSRGTTKKSAPGWRKRGTRSRFTAARTSRLRKTNSTARAWFVCPRCGPSI